MNSKEVDLFQMELDFSELNKDLFDQIRQIRISGGLKILHELFLLQ